MFNSLIEVVDDTVQEVKVEGDEEQEESLSSVDGDEDRSGDD